MFRTLSQLVESQVICDHLKFDGKFQQKYFFFTFLKWKVIISNFGELLISINQLYVKKN